MYSTASDKQKKVRIAIYQGESEELEDNQFIGEFLLEGLSEVEAGNEILVRFDLDLNGILKVTAEEHDTGLQKQLKIENAVSRFRRESEAAASAAAGQRPAAVKRAAGGDVPASPDLVAAIERSTALIAKALSVAAKASAEDRGEIDRLVKDLTDASAARSVPRLQKVEAELEDLVFYLQDA
jgi:molecular chaperone DnaK